MLTDKQIQDVVFSVLRRWKDDRAWDRYTRESGPYDVTSLRAEVLEIIRAVLAVAEQVSQVVPQGHKAVPLKKLAKLAALIDPPPTEVDGRRYVFKNPMAAEVLTRLSAEVRELLEYRADGVKRLDPVPTAEAFDGITGRPYEDGVAVPHHETFQQEDPHANDPT